ncbi:protein SPEAR1-like [Oryza brachyantha]|uniref:Uncharacterized protein n=1 Tax=Oryza brachyantha TaxID=4533 RepID=J3M9N3_ORYBR|nr:protein SPEAR1-like [Oryza brachyantha]
MEWPGRGRPFGSRKGKRSAGSGSDKPKQPQRGLGVAQLEKIRIQSEMAAGYLQINPPHLGLQQPPVPGIGSLNLQEDARSSNSLSSSPSSSSFHANINVSSPYPIHPNLAMAYGGSRSGDIRYGEFQSTNPIIRSPPNHEVSYGAGADHYYSHPSSDPTLSLFEPEESIYLRRQYYSLNQPVDSMNPDDPEDVDLELKL